jgi:hypothetical protein
MDRQEPSLIRSALLAVAGGGLASVVGWVAVHGWAAGHQNENHPAPVEQAEARPELPAFYINGRQVTSIDQAQLQPDYRSPEALAKAYDNIGEKRFDQYRELRDQAAAAARSGEIPRGIASLEDIDYMERNGLIAW